MSGDEEVFVLSDVIAESISFVAGDLPFEPQRILWLIDALLFAAYDDPSETVLRPCLNMCDLLLRKKTHLCEAYLRKSQTLFHLGSFVQARQTLDIASQHSDSVELDQEIEDFRKELIEKVTRDGKIALFILGGAVSAFVVWMLSRNKRRREALAAEEAASSNFDESIISNDTTSDSAQDI